MSIHDRLPDWFKPVAAILDWGMQHAKPLGYLLMALAAVWAFVYCVRYQIDIKAGPLYVLATVFGIGATLAGVKTWATNRPATVPPAPPGKA